MGSIPTAPANKKKEEDMKTTPAQFVRQVKQEIAKITWPTRSESMQGTIVVLAMCVALAFFLFLIDFIFAAAIRFVVGG